MNNFVLDKLITVYINVFRYRATLINLHRSVWKWCHAHEEESYNIFLLKRFSYMDTFDNMTYIEHPFETKVQTQGQYTHQRRIFIHLSKSAKALLSTGNGPYNK